MRLLAYFFAHGCRKIAKKHPNSHIFRKSWISYSKAYEHENYNFTAFKKKYIRIQDNFAQQHPSSTVALSNPTA